MKYFLLLLSTSVLLFANDYYAKLEPVNTYNVKSSISGKIVYVNEDIESKISNNSVIVHIDDKINKIELKQSNIKFKSLKKIIQIQKNTLKSFKKVSSKSKFEKDQQEITILNTSANLSDLNIKIANLKDIIKNKTLKENNTYISNINAKKGDYVNPGFLLYTAQDLSKAKLEIFVSFDDVKDLKNKTIFLDDKKTDLKISKIFKTADTKHISAYKVQIIVPEVSQFSKLIKVSFK